MWSSLLLCALWLAVPAQAAEGEDTAARGAPTETTGEADAAARAEYVRLSHEMARLAEKPHWDGVEHAYIKALATGVPLTFEEHMYGVSAATSRGDIATARERLLAAKAVRDADPEVIETLWAIDTAFARVELRAEPGAVLEVEALPFDPKQAKAVGFARHRLEETGTFVGYLPAGRYTLAQTPFVVAVHEIGAEPIVVDTRSAKTRRRDR